MTTRHDWRRDDAAYAKDYGQRLDAETPEPLFESFQLPGKKICLRCAKEYASSLLVSPFGMKPVLPLCSKCAADWNLSGYHLFRGIHPKTLLMRLVQFKLKHPLHRPSLVELYQDVRNLLRWLRKMNRLRKAER